MKRLMAGVTVLALAIVVSAVQAEEKKADPTGTWKWTVNAGGKERTSTLKLKLEGDKLTGAVLGGRNNSRETPIEDASFKKGEVSFKVTMGRADRKITVKYKGKLSGDTIKGKAEFDRDGEVRSNDWEAKRSKD